ncbi:hypothetical protein vseg_000884 [Gypsophila vaccaria]
MALQNSSSSVTSLSRGSIPNNVRKTIQNIKEIAKNHNEDDIYAMLKDCSMDPNETVQRLLHLDTFHQVKSKRGKRNEVVKSRPGEDSRWKPGHHARGIRRGRGNMSSQRNSSDAGGRRINSNWKENGVVETKERDFRNPPAPVSKELNGDHPQHVEKVLSVSANGQLKMPNGNLGNGHDSKPSGIENYRLKENTGPGSGSSSTIIPKARAEIEPSASDPVLMPSEVTRIPPAGGVIQREERIERIPTEASPHVPFNDGLDKTKVLSDSHPNLSDPHNLGRYPASTPVLEKEANKPAHVKHTNGSIELLSAEKSHAPNIMSADTPISTQDVGPLAGVEEAASKLAKLKFFDGQNVIIPDHIQVPDAVKNVLSFGSINASFGVKANYIPNGIVKNSHSIMGEAPDEAYANSSSGVEDTVDPAVQAEHREFQNLQSHSPDENHPIDTQVSSCSNNDDQLKEHNLPAMGPPFPVVQTTPGYSFGFMPPRLANTLVQPEGFESQAHVSSSMSGGSPAVSTPSVTPPLTQSNGVGQASLAMSQQQISLFRQPYPPNFFPYGHYYSPFYLPPNMHQYYSHSTFPPPLPTSNVFVPPPSTAAATKTTPAHYKPQTNAGNQAPNGMPSGYGVYSSSQAGYSHNTMATSGNPSMSADLLPTASKDNYAYSGQQNEGSAVWLTAAGRDTSGFPLNSFLNFPPQGHQLISPQSGHGPFAVYHTLQPIPSPAPGHPLLQQSQPLIGHVESVGPPSNAYQQSQRQHQSQPQPQPQPQPQLNWNM